MKQSYPIKRGTGNGERVDYWRNCIVEAHQSLLDSCVVVANYDEQRLLLADTTASDASLNTCGNGRMKN